jgi:serine/threonine-protein kinase RsbW
MKKSISILSKLENICHVEKLVDEISEECNLSSDLYGKVLIATIEAVNNSIVHGNKFDASNSVDVSVQITDIENISGRGVFLMRNLADDIKFQHNGSHVELIFKLIK